MNTTDLKDGARRISIAAGEAVSVRVAFGARIRCVHGNVWLTQEGDARDYCYAAGLTFCISRPGLAVLTTLTATSVVLVTPPGANGCATGVPGTLSIDSLECLTRGAREAQSAHVRNAVRRSARAALNALRRLCGLVRQLWQHAR